MVLEFKLELVLGKTLAPVHVTGSESIFEKHTHTHKQSLELTAQIRAKKVDYLSSDCLAPSSDDCSSTNVC